MRNSRVPAGNLVWRLVCEEHQSVFLVVGTVIITAHGFGVFLGIDKLSFVCNKKGVLYR